MRSLAELPYVEAHQMPPHHEVVEAKLSQTEEVLSEEDKAEVAIS